ncbi:hypothetical protein, partial [Klebsiella pneumoniae]|uniref:hypothetical protein n=1 Tax=Klebsiella pneumoniae TaxID=573 RepID=UPI00273188F8
MNIMNSHCVASFAKKFVVSSALIGSLGVSLWAAASTEPLSASLPIDIRNSKVINVVTEAKW